MNVRHVLYISEINRPGEGKDNTGISVMDIDEDKGKLIRVQHVPLCATTNVSCISSDGKRLYVTAEETDPAVLRVQGDRIIVFSLDGQNGSIGERIATAPTLTPNPGYLSVSPDQNWMMVANHTTHQAAYKVVKQNGKWVTRLEYDDANVLLYSLDSSGIPGTIEDAVIHQGSGPLKTQTHAHPHSAVFSPDGRFIAVCDKGADTVSLYTIRDRLLELAGEPWSSEPGDEPRFCAFHPTEPYLYVNHEGNVGLDVLGVTESGELTHIQTIQACPDGFSPRPGIIHEHQGIAMHPQGKYLYSVVRGVDAIAVFGIDPANGTLKILQFAPMEKDSWPRCCHLTSDGKWLIAGSRTSGDLYLYSVEENGALTLKDHILHTSGVAYVSSRISN